MIKGTTKEKPKKDVCHFAIVLKVMFHKWFPLEGTQSREKKKHTKQPQKDRKGRETV
jgi:hypothetical protein